MRVNDFNFIYLVDNRRRPIASFRTKREPTKGERILLDGQPYLVVDVEWRPGGAEIDGRCQSTNEFYTQITPAISDVPPPLHLRSGERGDGEIQTTLTGRGRIIGVFNLDRDLKVGDRLTLDDVWLAVVGVEGEILSYGNAKFGNVVTVMLSVPPKPPLEFHTQQPQAAA